MDHNPLVEWTVILADEFEPEFDALPTEVQDELLAQARVRPAAAGNSVVCRR
jgi:hypothetical protein